MAGLTFVWVWIRRDNIIMKAQYTIDKYKNIAGLTLSWAWITTENIPFKGAFNIIGLGYPDFTTIGNFGL